MAHAIAISTYQPGNFEVKLFDTITNVKDKAVDKAKQGYTSLKNTFQNIRNKVSYIPEYTNEHDSHASTIVGWSGEVFSDAQSSNTTGHLIHLADKNAELYMQKEIQEFRKYLGKTADIVGFEASNAKTGAIAAVTTDSLLRVAIPFVDTNFYVKLSESAKKYGVSQEVKKLYAILHETAHTHQSLKNIFYNLIYDITPIPSEKLVEAKVCKYALKKAEEATTTEEREQWLAIADIAESRYSRVREIYRGKDAKKSKDSKETKKEDSEAKYEGKEENIEEKTDKAEQDTDSLEAKVDDAEACEDCEVASE